MKTYINQLEAHIQNINFDSGTSVDKESVETETEPRFFNENHPVNNVSKGSNQTQTSSIVNE